MCDYYSSSFIDIAAAVGKDGRHGLFFPSGAEHCEDMRAEFCIGGKPYKILDMLHWDSILEELSLLKRAWMYQEKLLAPRNLVFRRNGLAWECDHHRLSEVFPIAMAPDKELDSSFTEELEPGVLEIF